MKKREWMLTIATILVIGVGLWLNFAPGDEAMEGTELALAGDLDTIRSKFDDNIKMLKKGGQINEAYDKLRFSLEDARTPGMDPGMDAQSQLYDVLTKTLGVATPVISNSVPKDIPNVEEYYFINITFKVSGAEIEMKKLLSNMERLGFLIQSFKIGQPNHGQSDYVDMEVVVSKLVKRDKPLKPRNAWRPRT